MIVIGGPCVIEDESSVREIASQLKRELTPLPIDYFFKASFDKANRSAGDSFRGPGLSRGLEILAKIKKDFGLKVLTDVHEVGQVEPVSEIVDCIQIPAFLCRQTDLVLASAEAALKRNICLNIKKGQFLAPWDVKNIVEKVKSVWGTQRPLQNLWITERGVSFGYNQLVVDMVSFQVLDQLGVTSIYDATHSIQKPGAAPGGKTTGGERKYLESLARAAMAAGAQGLFFECHPNPSQAKSDGPNALYLDKVQEFVKQMLSLNQFVRPMAKLLPEAQLGNSS